MGKPNNKYPKLELMDLKQLTHHHHQQPQAPHLGVLTRARALALQRANDASSTYLQLRNRRLHKLNASKRSHNKRKNNKKEGKAVSGHAQGSCGENVLESEAKERITRETTPCSLIRNPDAVRTPGSTTKRTAPADTDRTRSSSVIMPTTQQMNEFFADTENEDQRRFMEKYNYDVINDKPLPGRYEWEKLDP